MGPAVPALWPVVDVPLVLLVAVLLRALDLAPQRQVTGHGQARLDELLELGGLEVVREDQDVRVRAPAAVVAEGALLAASVLELDAREDDELDGLAARVLTLDMVLLPRALDYLDRLAVLVLSEAWRGLASPWILKRSSGKLCFSSGKQPIYYFVY